MNGLSNATLGAEARKALDDATWAYLVGGAGTEATLRRNRLAFERLAFRPRVLRDVHRVDAATDALGVRMRIPVVLAPIGNLEVFRHDGPNEVAHASSAFGVMQVVAGVGEVPKISLGSTPKAYQIYVDGDHAWLQDRVALATDLGYRAIVLTVDVPKRARRERQMLAGYRFVGTGPKREHLARTTWTELEVLRSSTELPLVVKGVQTGADARVAAELGADGVWVSNHGGRQLDHGRPSLDALAEVVEALEGAVTIMLDGGVMTGSDVLKGIALGADLVAIGKLQCLALAAGGADRVHSMLETLEDEITSQMGMLGATSLAELPDECVVASIPSGLPNPADPWSAVT